MSTKDNRFLKNIVGAMISKDPDDTEIARKFYEDFWPNIYTNEKFRGDTIFSFNTIAGCIIRCLPDNEKPSVMPSKQRDRLQIIIDSSIDNNVKCNFKKFYQIYHTLSNFMPVVKERSNRGAYIQTIKNLTFKEFPDLLFNDIRNYYVNNRTDSNLSNSQINIDYFHSFKREDKPCWKEYVEQNYLQDFYEDIDYQITTELYPKIELPFTANKANKIPSSDKADYIEPINQFILLAISIIKKRAKRLDELT